eukprot:g32102.t1
MVPRNAVASERRFQAYAIILWRSLQDCKILGKPVFHDSTLNSDRMYCGDWWRTDFFFNITVAELIGDKLLETPRVQELIDIMQINTSWHINAISDGQRRRHPSAQCNSTYVFFYLPFSQVSIARVPSRREEGQMP